MKIGVRAMNHLAVLGKVSVCLIRPDRKGYTKRHAPFVGLMVRSVKLYDGILHQIAEHRAELAAVFIRPFIESVIKLEYLMRSGPASVRSFIETSYRPEKDMLTHLQGIKARRQLIPIETRMLRSIRNHLRDARISHADLLERKNWDLVGKNMRTLINSLKWELGYTYVFAASSHFVHGSWYDLVVNHLKRDGGKYFPQMIYETPDPGYLAPQSVLFARQLYSFVNYFRLDRTGVVSELLVRFEEFFRSLDQAWEQILKGDKQ